MMTLHRDPDGSLRVTAAPIDGAAYREPANVALLVVVLGLAATFSIWVVLATVLAVGVVVGLGSYSRRRSELRYRDGVVRYQGPFRERTLGPPRGLRVERVTAKSFYGSLDLEIWEGEGGGISLSTRAWEDEALASFAAELGIVPVVHPERLRYTALARRYPRSFPLSARHPTLTSLGVVVIGSAMFVAVDVLI